MKSPLCLFSLVLACLGRAAAPAMPNVLLILPDQMRGTALGCDGNPDIQTPNLDHLAAEGMRFERMYANVPVCGPARACILTGTYPNVNGMVCNDLRLRENENTLAKVFAADGYRTGFVGKWHLDGGPRLPGYVPPGPRRQGFQFWAGYECDHLSYFHPTYFRDTAEPIRIDEFEPQASCDFAAEFLKTQPKGKPFFLAVFMGPPHDPYTAPEQYLKRYNPAAITPPVNWVQQKNSPRIKYGSLAPPPPLGSRVELATYYAAVTAVDEQVGRLLAVLREQGLADNTIVFFTSDHGDMLNSHGMRNKRKPYDESARIPGILRWPGHVPVDQTVNTLFSHVDIAPTLLALAGIKPPATMQGTDLSRVALGETTDGPSAVLLQMFASFAPDQVLTPWRGLITARYTYARFENRPWMLFDHESDPSEMKNLAAEPAQAELIGHLNHELAGLMRKNGDAWSFDVPEPVEQTGALTRHPFYSMAEYRAWNKSEAGGTHPGQP